MSILADSENPEALFYGRLSDGNSAMAYDVDVRLAPAGVEILRAGNPPLTWPYGTLAIAEPLSEHAIDALLTSTATPGASLFVGEGTFARRLARRAPHLSVRAERWRHARPWLYGTAGLIGLALAIWALDLSPARAIAGLLPEKARASLGQQVIQSMTEGRRVCHTQAGRAALDRMVERLSAAAGTDGTFKIVVSDWGLINAFAAPGEQIVLTRGIIEQAKSADEVAGVLAHEMGHGIERHPETGIVRAIGMSAALELMMGGSAGTLGNAGLVLAQLSYTRAAEEEADVQALRILRNAGISPKGLSGFFRRVMKIEDESKLGKAISRIEVLRTHPMTEGRIRSVEGTPPYPSTPSLTDAEWQDLKTICRATADSDDGEAPEKRARPRPQDPGRDI